MQDIIIQIGKSIIQHGKSNNRVYVMKYHPDDSPIILKKINELAKENRYTKIFAKIPLMQAMEFIEDGFVIEAEVPKFFKGKETCYFLCKYFSMSRKLDQFKSRDESIQTIAMAKSKKQDLKKLDPPFHISMLEERNAVAMANIYAEIFKSYPFPIHDPEYIKSTMAKNIVYFGLFENDKLLAISSAELDTDAQNAELTDFATAPGHEGKNYSLHLLKQMEEVLPHYGIKTVYTIARSASPGMNVTFAKANYIFAGKLLNNTQIAGEIENMNVWYKFL